RQAGFADAPAPQLPLVEPRRCKSKCRYFDVACCLAAKDTDRNRGRQATRVPHGNERAADNSTSEESIDAAKNRRAGDCVEYGQCLALLVQNPGSIYRQLREEDSGSWRKGRHTF